MAQGNVLQYVGARYVPQFYKNPNGTWDWLAGVQYEPLTIVKYGSSTYTSRQLVPATAGTPNAEPEYWALTGEYNGAILSLNQNVNRILYRYANVEAMKADSSLSQGMIVSTESYYSLGDYGSAEYVIESSSSLFSVALNNGLYAVPMLKYEMSIAALGAKKNEDATDIISALLNAGVTAVIPPFSYICNNLEMPRYSKIRGVNNQKSCLYGNVDNGNVIVCNKNSAYSVIDNIRLQATLKTVTGIHIDYAGASGYPFGANITCSNLTGGSMYKHIYVDPQTGGGCHIVHCNFEGAENASIDMRGADSFIEDCDIHNCVSGIYVGSNNSISGVKIWLATDSAMVVFGNHNNITCDVQECQYGIRFAAGSSYNNLTANGDRLSITSPAYFVNLSASSNNNVMILNYRSTVDGENGLVLGAGASNNIITFTTAGAYPEANYISGATRAFLSRNIVTLNSKVLNYESTVLRGASSYNIPSGAENVVALVNIVNANVARAYTFNLAGFNDTLNLEASSPDFTGRCILRWENNTLSVLESTGDITLSVSYV